jgi:sucrose synthase
MTLSKVYSFWKFVSKLNRQETRRYLEMFYILKFRELAKTVPLSSDDVSTIEKMEKKAHLGPGEEAVVGVHVPDGANLKLAV